MWWYSLGRGLEELSEVPEMFYAFIPMYVHTSVIREIFNCKLHEHKKILMKNSLSYTFNHTPHDLKEEEGLGLRLE